MVCDITWHNFDRSVQNWYIPFLYVKIQLILSSFLALHWIQFCDRFWEGKTKMLVVFIRLLCGQNLPYHLIVVFRKKYYFLYSRSLSDFLPVCWAPIQVVLVQKIFSQREWSHDYTKVVIQVNQNKHFSKEQQQ